MSEVRQPTEAQADHAAIVSVVGGRGFLGSRICSILARRGHKVHAIDRGDPTMLERGVHPRAIESDYVVWAASSINPMIAQNDPDRVALDIEAFESYVRTASQIDGGPRTILLSSGGTVYDDEADPPYAETSPVRPRTAYGAAKLQLERILLSCDESGLVLRISNAYGPGQTVAPGQGVIAHWMHAIAAGQDVHIFGDANVSRDYVHVDDVSRAVAAAIESDYDEHRILNIGAGRPTTLHELHGMTAAAVGDLSIEPVQHPARLFDARSTWLDCGRAATTLGWYPTIPLAEGLVATWRALADELKPDSVESRRPSIAAISTNSPVASERVS